MKKFLALALFTFVTHHGVALACPDGKGGHGPKLIEELDSNKDSQLSRDEVKANPFFLDKFDEIDSNKDGLLTKDELKAHHDAHRPPHPAPDAPQSESDSAK